MTAGRICARCQRPIRGMRYEKIVPFSASGARPDQYVHHHGDPDCTAERGGRR